MKNKLKLRINAGGSSLLLIFILLCLATFASLSLVSANADLQLSRKNAAAVAQYYAADAAAQERLWEIDRAVSPIPAGDGYAAACLQALSGLEGVHASGAPDGGLSVTYDIPAGNPGRRLYVRLSIPDPPPNGAPWRIREWRIIAQAPQPSDADKPRLWDGNL